MKLSLNKWSRIFLVTVCFAAAIIGFMLKLPSQFRHHDKELHTLFYFLAAAFLNLLFSNKNIAIHLLIFGLLYLFGVSIEYAQAYSNEFFHVRIHGRYDPEDVRSNLKGLTASSVLWIIVVGFLFVYNKATAKNVVKTGSDETHQSDHQKLFFKSSLHLLSPNNTNQNKIMDKTPHSLYTVRFTDCDPFGHLNNARYIDYFLNAREDHLKTAYQLDLSHFYKQGVSWLVSGHEISYLRPANYNEVVLVKSALIQAAHGSLLVEMLMTDEKQTHIKSFMWTKFMHINAKTGKREDHADSFMEFARSVEVTDVDVSKGYQQRLKAVIEHIKQQGS